MIKTLFLGLVVTLPIVVIAQNDTTKQFSWSAYSEIYYSYDFSKPANHEKPSFIYNHKRHNEVNINLAYVKGSYNASNTRGNLALMVGNYTQYNLAAEAVLSRFIYEANMGIKLSKTKNIWLDAGILPSHIGFESAVSADCWTLTRSLVAENSPYYETGAKVSFTNTSGNFNAAFLILNGWQRIQRPDNFNTPSVGMQLNYKPRSNWTLNYSNFIGSDKPDSVKALRVYHNFYSIYETDSWGFILGFDIGRDEKADGKPTTWYVPVLILRKKMNRYAIAARVEYFNDKNQIIISTGTKNGFQALGLSANLDFNITKNALFRVETRYFNAKDALFLNNSKKNVGITTALSIKI